MIEQVKINDKEYPYLLSFRAIEKISEIEAINKKNGEPELGIKTFKHALYWALYSGHYLRTPKEPFEFALEDMTDLLDLNFHLLKKIREDMEDRTKEMNEGNEVGKPTTQNTQKKT